jgi:O-antigen ligase
MTLGTRWAISHPLLGIGPGGVRAYVEAFRVRLNQGAANHVEMSFLQAWLDGGILGGLGFLLVWLTVILPGPGTRLLPHERIRFSCVKGLAAALTIYVLLNVTFDNLAFWLILGLVAAYQAPRQVACE